MLKPTFLERPWETIRFFLLYSELIFPCEILRKCDNLQTVKIILSTLLQLKHICSFSLLLVLLLECSGGVSLQALGSWNPAIAVLAETPSEVKFYSQSSEGGAINLDTNITSCSFYILCTLIVCIRDMFSVPIILSIDFLPLYGNLFFSSIYK